MYEKEKNALKKLISPSDWEKLKSHRAILAGGAITSIFTGREVADVDIYFRSEKDALVCVLSNFWDSGEEGFENCLIKHYTNKSVLVGDNFQLITVGYYDTPKDIFGDFDFTVCMGAFDFSTGKFVLHKRFLQDNAARRLVFNTGTAYPLVSALRVDKYRNKGYSISKAEYLRVMCSVMKLEISSWEEAREHIGGMYGIARSGMFCDNKPFSVESLAEQLANINLEPSVEEYSHPVVEMDYLIEAISGKETSDGVLSIVRSMRELPWGCLATSSGITEGKGWEVSSVYYCGVDYTYKPLQGNNYHPSFAFSYHRGDEVGFRLDRLSAAEKVDLAVGYLRGLIKDPNLKGAIDSLVKDSEEEP